MLTAEEELDEAIVLLATTDDVESEPYADASSVLFAQGRAALPELLPRLFALADAKPSPMREELTSAAAALLCRTMHEPPAPHDAAIEQVIERRAGELASWRHDDRSIAAASIAVHYRAVRDAYVAELARRTDFTAADGLVLLRVDELPSWAWDRAVAALAASDPAIRVAAALVVARRAPVAPEIGARLDEILVAGALLAISRVLVLSDHALPALPKGPFGPSTDLVEGKVVFVGANLVTLRVDDRNVNLKFRPEGLTKGDSVRLHRGGGGQPRAVEWTRPDGTTERAEL